MRRWIVVALLVAALSPVVVVEALARDSPPPIELAPGLGEVQRAIVGQFDLIPLIDHVRFVDLEYRQSDHLVLLYFELRRYPYLSSEEVWLGSRCVPPADFTADTFAGMDGGYVHISRAADPELVYVRGPDQSPC
jgi:hypothetical protein